MRKRNTKIKNFYDLDSDQGFRLWLFFFEVTDWVHKRFQNKLPIVYHTAAKLRGGAIQWILVPTVGII